MPMDTTVIPTTGRSPAAMAQHIQLWKESEDIWRVYNPTDQDYPVYFDRRRSNQKWVVPNKNKDIGHGKGCQDMPKYAMILYRDHMGIELINAKSKADWETKKVEFRLEDRHKMEESMALRSNDPKEWDILVPLLVKGIVTRFGGDDFDEVEEQKIDNSGSMSMGDAAMERLGMTNMDLGIEANKADLIQQISAS